MKRLLTALLLCSAAGGLANAQSAQKYDTLSNELEIMSGVLKRPYDKMPQLILGE